MSSSGGVARNEILADGRLGGLEPGELAERFGTPLYVYDLDVVERQVAALRAVLPARFDLAYAVKANPSLGVVAFLGSLGLGADVASGGELELVRAAGIDPATVVFTGPGKRDPELRAAVAAGLRAVTVESVGELERLEAIAAANDGRVAVLLRASATDTASLESVRLVGDDGARKFGMAPADVRAAARLAAASPHLELLGLHAFGASNVLDAEAIADHVASTVRTAAAMAVEAGVPLRLVDCGGGLGIPYGPADQRLDLDVLGRRLAELDRVMAADPVSRGARVLFEPGRFLLGPAGAYLASVVDRKDVDGEAVVVLDGGIHHLLRPALVGQPHRIHVCGTDASEARTRPVTIAGPLCSGLDVLGRHVDLVPPPVGDLVAVLDVGAYGFTESMPLFLSHPTPAEVAVRHGEARLLRPPIEPAAWLAGQCRPDWSEPESDASAAPRSS